jgi:Tfp pilus assembly protein PilF
LRRNEPKESISSLQKGLKSKYSERKTDEVKAWLGMACVRNGDYIQSMKICRDVIRSDPDFAKGHSCLGLSYLGLDDKVSALEQYKMLKTLDKDLANHLFRSMCP